MRKTIPIILITTLLLLPICPQHIEIEAKKNSKQPSEPSEINMYIEGDIPTIKPSNWTTINLTLVDRIGINWSQLKGSSQIKRWPFLFPFQYPEWRRYLGYTSLKLEPEIVKGETNGWHLKFDRSTITNTTTGRIHKIQLQVMIDDTVIDYSIIVGIKCIRYDVFGQEVGVSLMHLPLKATPMSNIQMKTTILKKIVPPKTITNFQFNVTNKGDYREMFGFKIESNDGIIAHVNTPVIVLNPRETRPINLRILTSPKTLIDLGTPHKINIYAYSYENNNTMISLGSVTVVTQGTYIPPVILIVVMITTIFLMSIYFLFRYIGYRKQKY